MQGSDPDVSSVVKEQTFPASVEISHMKLDDRISINMSKSSEESRTSVLL